MRCEVAQRDLSVAMDEGLPPSPEVEDHRRSCRTCTEFESGMWRLRELSRFEVAPPVPDLVPSIMSRVREETADRILGWSKPPHPIAGAVVAWLARRRAVAVPLVAGVIVGLVVTSGGLISVRKVPPVARADDVPRQLLHAAAGLQAYRATFDITELHWTRAVPRRTFVADVAFRSPESFRVQVSDRTTYPSEAWPRNDLTLVTDGQTWQATGPDPCPAAELPTCPRRAPVVLSVENRAPFDTPAPLPTDVIVPMTVLAASDRVAVIGPGRVAGRDAVAVQLAYQDATPLFQYLQFLGSWRPFFPQDRVTVWLDHQTWFPLEYQVFPAPGAERIEWASQRGLPRERPAVPLFTAIARSISTSPPSSLSPTAVGSFAVPAAPVTDDEGFRDLPRLSSASPPPGGPLAIQPTRTEGLSLWRAGSYDRTPTRPYSESVVAYAKGLSWITVTTVRGWNQAQLFGVGPFAEPVSLGSGRGFGYYEPATTARPRRVSLHTSQGEFLVATDLPRAALLTVAGSLPVVGLAEPSAWRTFRWPGGVVVGGLTPSEAIAGAAFPVLMPGTLPTGYRAVAAETIRGGGTNGVTVVFRRPAAELDGVGLRLYQATGQTLPPPTGPDEQMVQVRGVAGRWSPQDHVLEWIEGSVYRSLTGPSFDIPALLVVADSLRAPGT